MMTIHAQCYFWKYAELCCFWKWLFLEECQTALFFGGYAEQERSEDWMMM